MTSDRLESVATRRVGVNVGLLMLSAQAANKALRHCRIGAVTIKPLSTNVSPETSISR